MTIVKTLPPLRHNPPVPRRVPLCSVVGSTWAPANTLPLVSPELLRPASICATLACSSHFDSAMHPDAYFDASSMLLFAFRRDSLILFENADLVSFKQLRPGPYPKRIPDDLSINPYSSRRRPPRVAIHALRRAFLLVNPVHPLHSKVLTLQAPSTPHKNIHAPLLHQSLSVPLTESPSNPLNLTCFARPMGCHTRTSNNTHPFTPSFQASVKLMGIWE